MSGFEITRLATQTAIAERIATDAAQLAGKEIWSSKFVAQTTREFLDGTHTLFTDGSWQTQFRNTSVLLRHPNGAEVSVRPDKGQLLQLSQRNYESEYNGGQSRHLPIIGKRDARTGLRANDATIVPLSTPDQSVAMLMDGTTVTSGGDGATRVRRLFGQSYTSDGHVTQQTVLNKVTGIESTLFSNGATLTVNPNGRSIFVPGNFRPGEIANSYNFLNGKFESTSQGITSTDWRNGLSMLETATGRVHFSSVLDDRFRLHFTSQGLLDNRDVDLASRTIRSSAQKSSQPRLRMITQDDQGSTVIGLRNGLNIVEHGSESVSVRGRSGAQLFRVAPNGEIEHGTNVHKRWSTWWDELTENKP